jgi:aminoglycoside N3'-acetyltransferase
MPRTRRSLAADFARLGVESGATLLVHSSLKAVGWVVGGPVAVVQALLDTVGPAGTIVVPTQDGEYSDPAAWINPPVPEAWWPVIRSEMPAFDPRLTPSRYMGVVAETVRTWPGARRSGHPAVSFAAIGARAAEVTADHPLDLGLGDRSPLGTLYRRDAMVLLIGVGYDRATAFPLASRGCRTGPWSRPARRCSRRAVASGAATARSTWRPTASTRSGRRSRQPATSAPAPSAARPRACSRSRTPSTSPRPCSRPS